MVALGAAGFLLLMSMLDPGALEPAIADRPSMLAMLGIVSALLYAMGLALGSESQARSTFWLNHAEEDRYRLSPATWPMSSPGTAATAMCCSSRRRPSRCSAPGCTSCTVAACSIGCMSPTGRPI